MKTKNDFQKELDANGELTVDCLYKQSGILTIALFIFVPIKNMIKKLFGK